VCNGGVTSPQDAATEGDGRPWPSAGPDADWWSEDAGTGIEVLPEPVAAEAGASEAEDDAPADPSTVDTAAAETPEPTTAAAPTVRVPLDRTGPYDTPPRVRSTPPTLAPPARESSPIPVLRRRPLPLPPGVLPVAAEPAPESTPTPEVVDEFDRAEAAATDPALAHPIAPPRPVPTDLVSAPLLTRPIPAPPSPRTRPPGRSTRAPRPPKNPRAPWIAMPGLVVLLLAAAFLGWVSAEPFWLAVGHGRTGTVTILAGGTSGCHGSFTAPDFTVSTVDIYGLAPDECRPGTARPAEMVSAGAAHAFATDHAGLLLRTGVGLGLLLLCGLLIALVTGTRKLTGWHRGSATFLSLAAPLLVAATTATLTY
jgi:hypothetical protein